MCGGITVFGLLLATSLAGAQAPPAKDTASTDPHTAMPERPTVATHAGTVAKGWLELESGVEFDRFAGGDRNTTFMTVAKLGVASHMQLSLFTNASKADGASGGFGDLAVGLKWRVLDDNAILGDFALLPSLKMPTGSVSSGTGTGSTDASLLLISSRDVGPVHIDLNAGYTRRSDGNHAPREQALWTTSFGGKLVGDAQWTVELYGNPGMSGSDPLVGLLFGPTYTLRNWLVLDAGVIVPVAGGQPHAVYTGATYNLGRLF